MAKWKKQSHCVYQCKYHLVWCPKYRYRVLTGDVGTLVEESLRSLCEWEKVEVLELNVQPDHVHLVLQIPPRISVSEAVGILKGKTAIKMFKSFPGLKKKPYWGNHFWAKGYCVTTIGMDEEKIRRYVKYQEENEKREEGDEREFGLLLEAPQSHLLWGWLFTFWVSEIHPLSTCQLLFVWELILRRCEIRVV